MRQASWIYGLCFELKLSKRHTREAGVCARLKETIFE
jgi:hypothetical protein